MDANFSGDLESACTLLLETKRREKAAKRAQKQKNSDCLRIIRFEVIL
jgi:hypothetical protein